MRALAFVAIAVSALVAGPVAAQPKGKGKNKDKGSETDKPAAGKGDARALLASGLKLFKAEDYLGALVVFRDAYERFPSAKILLNIGTTLRQLGRDAEAANVYQRYLDAPASEADKKPQVTKVLAELDKKVGIVEIAVEPTDAEVQLGTEDWQPAAALARHRVSPGTLTVRSRKDGYEPFETTLEVAAGASAPLSITLEPTPPPQAPLADARPAREETIATRASVTAAPPSRFGAFAHGLVDVLNRAGAARVGATYEVIPRLSAEAAVMGPIAGAYAGARYAILAGRYRPVVAVGMPVFFGDDTFVAVRAAAGVEIVINRHFSVLAELGVERLLGGDMSYARTLLVPAVGATGRL